MMKPIVLFVCTGNSARSQMAEALMKHVAGDAVEVHSAGTEPKEINPLTTRAMNEIGVSMDGQYPKPVKEFLGRHSNRVMVARRSSGGDRFRGRSNCSISRDPRRDSRPCARMD